MKDGAYLQPHFHSVLAVNTEHLSAETLVSEDKLNTIK